MPFFVQYDADGNISTVVSDIAPECENQIEFPEPIDVSGKKVNIITKQLEDIE